MDAILGQDLAFDLARNLAAILAFHLAEILAIPWYFDLSLNHTESWPTICDGRDSGPRSGV